MNLKVKIKDLEFKNPVITASGTFGYGIEFQDFIDLERLGGITLKGISLKPMEGNPPPRIWETPCGILNSIGLENVGIERFLKEKLPPLKRLNTRVIANILGNTIEEYIELARCLDGEVDAIELNVSCPNVKKGGIFFGTDRIALFNLVEAVRNVVKKSLLITKLPPEGNIKETASIAEDAGSDAISLINTIPAMAIDIKERRPVFKNVIGGLSGPCIKPIALRMVWEAQGTVKIPVIGMGGITDAGDAIEFIIAGATLVGIGTQNFINPKCSLRIIEGIEDYLRKNSIDDINRLRASITV